MRTCTLVTLAVFLSLPPGVRAAEPVRKPNILFILADDLGWADVGYHGSPYKTPHIDRLAREGVRLEQHYVHPVCSPTRTALMSGRFASRYGVLSPTNNRVFDPGTVTLASALKAGGYFTAISGKWHLGSKLEWGPRKYGFERSYGCLAGGIDQYLHLYKGGPYQRTWHRNDEFVDEEGHSTDLFTREAIQTLGEKRDRPFFLYVAFTAVHLPVQEPDRWQALYKDAKVPSKHFAACVSHLDDSVGQLLQALERSGERENTVVIFTSDNGSPEKTTYGPAGGKPLSSAPKARPGQYPGKYTSGPGGDNGPLRGIKGTVYEGGIRVPAIVWWPGKLKPTVVQAPVHIADWMPTLLQLTGCQLKADRQYDGRDIWPLVTGKAKDLGPRTFFWARGSALRHGDWKLIDRGTPELYNLAADPYEKTNLAAKHPERVTELRAKLKAMRLLDSPRKK
jgi:arylsulfatase A-like enzyme